MSAFGINLEIITITQSEMSSDHYLISFKMHFTHRICTLLPHKMYNNIEYCTKKKKDSIWLFSFGGQPKQDLWQDFEKPISVYQDHCFGEVNRSNTEGCFLFCALLLELEEAGEHVCWYFCGLNATLRLWVDVRCPSFTKRTCRNSLSVYLTQPDVFPEGQLCLHEVMKFITDSCFWCFCCHLGF